VTTSMENLADISEHQVPSNEHKDQSIKFFICLFSFNWKNRFSPIETWI